MRRIALLILVLAAGYFSNRLKDADGLREKIFDVIQAGGDYTQVQSSRYERTVELGEIPEYSGQPYIVLNNNVPELLSEESVPTQAFETYYDLDRLGRCTGRGCQYRPKPDADRTQRKYQQYQAHRDGIQ